MCFYIKNHFWEFKTLVGIKFTTWRFQWLIIIKIIRQNVWHIKFWILKFSFDDNYLILNYLYNFIILKHIYALIHRILHWSWILINYYNYIISYFEKKINNCNFKWPSLDHSIIMMILKLKIIYFTYTLSLYMDDILAALFKPFNKHR